MRQPIATLGALITSVQGAGALPDHARDCLEQMKAQIRDMDDLCGLLLDQRPSRTRCGLDDVARHVVSAAEHAYDRRIELRASRCPVVADASGLGRAVWNLLDNARRAAGATGKVRVTVRRTSLLARLEVEDDGPGFGAGPPGRASLGLSIVEAVAREHHGRVEIGRSELGGASVALILPLRVEAQGPIPPNGAATVAVASGAPCLPGPGHLSIVICDDHRMFGESLSSVLAARGHDVVTCTTDPQVAVADVTAHRPDILVIDLALQQADGVDALRASLQASPTTRAVVLSGSGNPTWFAAARAAGAAACLVKHGDMRRILDAIDAVATGQQIFDHPAGGTPACNGADQGLLRTLTERERQVLECLVRGKRTTTIAIEMGMALSTTRSHVQSILYKLGAHSRLEAVSLVTAAGRIPLARSAGGRSKDTPFGGCERPASERG